MVYLIILFYIFFTWFNKTKKNNKLKIRHITSVRKLNYIENGEQQYQEYKEFTIKLNDYFEESDICNFLKNEPISDDFKEKFNRCCLNDLSKNYILKYLKKYIVSMQGGALHFGIADMPSLLTGIPYFGKIPIYDILDCVKICFEKQLRVKDVNNKTNKEVLQWFIENLNITIEKLIIDKSYIDNQYIDRLNKLIAKSAKSKLIWKKYDEKIKKWLFVFNKYVQRLRKIINDFNIRNEILKFIRKKAQYKKLKLEEYKQAIDFYKSNTIINHEITYDILRNDPLLPTDRCINTFDVKHNYNNHFSWLVIFKDHMINKLKKNKPRHPDEHIVRFSYLDFAKYMSNIQYSLISHECNFFVITFNIPSHPSNYQLEYNNINIEDIINKKPKNLIWYYKQRIMTENGPILV